LVRGKHQAQPTRYSQAHEDRGADDPEAALEQAQAENAERMREARANVAHVRDMNEEVDPVERIFSRF
jgi:hypothetical protein